MTEQTAQEVAQTEADDITLEQGFLSICNLAFEQWEAQKNMIGQLHYSNTDALGGIRNSYLDVEPLLQKTRIIGGACLSNDVPEYAAQLQPALVSLAIQAIQATLSLTDIRAAAKRLDHKAKIAAVVSEKMESLQEQ